MFGYFIILECYFAFLFDIYNNRRVASNKNRFGRMENQLKEISKRRLATFSLVVSVFLVVIKIIAALVSNSMGLYSEALNNGLDIVTVLITFLAIRMATRPADKDHPYGHGKYENLSALAQIIIISLLSFFIIYRSVERLVHRDFDLFITWHIFLVLAVSVVLNIIRVTYLGIIAKKYDSIAFKADFINYAGDIFSSFVVIIGLIFARFGNFIADPIASIIVSVAILFFGFKLALKTVRDLMGYIPEGVTDRVAKILEDIKEIEHIHFIKIHEVGNIKFINISISLKSSLHLSQVEKIKQDIRASVASHIHDAELIIDTRSKTGSGSVEDVIKEITMGHEIIKDIHNIFTYKVNAMLNISVHLELKKHISLAEAEVITKDIEQSIKSEIKNINQVYIHIEDENYEQDWDDITPSSDGLIDSIKKAVSPLIDPNTCHKFAILLRNHKYNISFHCYLNKEFKISCAHRITSAMESAIKEVLPHIDEVTIHAEPYKKD